MPVTRELTLNKKHLKLAGLLIALLLGVLVIHALADTDARNAGKRATESVTDLFRIDFRRDISSQLPPCTETGQAFWTTHLATIEGAIEAQGMTIQSIQAERSGNAAQRALGSRSPIQSKPWQGRPNDQASDLAIQNRPRHNNNP